MAGVKQKSESQRAILACNDWLRLGPGRSLVALWQQYRETPPNTVPTRSLHTLNKWAPRYDWAGRAGLYDQAAEDAKTIRSQEIMATGLALAHERVAKLQQLAAFLEAQLYERGTDGVYHNVWVPDVKQIGSGKDAERVDLERFNQGLISEYRATLDDLAKETGGRKQTHELSGPGGGPLTVQTVEELTDAELAAIARQDRAGGGGGGTPPPPASAP